MCPLTPALPVRAPTVDCPEGDAVLVGQLLAEGRVGELLGEVVELDGEGGVEDVSEHVEGELEAFEVFLRGVSGGSVDHSSIMERATSRSRESEVGNNVGDVA